MAVVGLQRVDGLLNIVRAYLPRRVESTGDFEDWQVVAPALIAIAADMFEGIMAAVPPGGRLRAEILSRSLAEYVISFAWLAAADEYQLRLRLRQLLKDEYLEREKGEDKLRDQIGNRARYRYLFDPATPRPGGPLPTALLDDANRDRLHELKADSSTPNLPNTFDMAFVADARWMSEIDLVAHNPFALTYFTVFTGPSFMTHPSVTAVAAVTLGSPPELVVGPPQSLGSTETPYGQALLSFLNMLLVASRTLGWPAEADVRAAVDPNANPA